MQYLLSLLSQTAKSYAKLIGPADCIPMNVSIYYNILYLLIFAIAVYAMCAEECSLLQYNVRGVTMNDEFSFK